MNGLRVLNTRPLHQCHALSQSIRKHGGVPIELPTLVIEPTLNDWLQLLPDLAHVNHAIFISSNAVHYFFEGLASQSFVWPSSINTIAIGHASASALQSKGLNTVETPTFADSEHVIQLPSLQSIEGQTILLIKGVDGRSLLAETIQDRGAQVITLEVYHRHLPLINHKFSQSLWQNNAIDIILITSQQSLLNLFVLFGEKARDWVCNKPCIVISKRLADAARCAGMQTVIISPIDDVVTTLVQQGQCDDNRP